MGARRHSWCWSCRPSWHTCTTKLPTVHASVPFLTSVRHLPHGAKVAFVTSLAALPALNLLLFLELLLLEGLGVERFENRDIDLDRGFAGVLDIHGVRELFGVRER